jgi:hypothetical protein
VSPNATQSFTLIVGQAPTISPPYSAAFVQGSNASYALSATGFPTPTFSTTGTLPSGVTLSPTGVLSGKPTGPVGTYTFPVTASNGVNPPATQSFTLTIGQIPTITSSPSATMTVGTSARVTLTASGYPTPTFSETGALPAGITLSSAGVLSGTPQAGSGGVYSIQITASNTVGTNSQSYTITVNEAAAFTSANSTTFAVGQNGSFTVTATGYPPPTFSETGALPNGVTLNPAGVLSGTPGAGSGGSYAITITASNGVGTAPQQSFTLAVSQPSSFTSANSTTFTAQTGNTFTVTASGFPKPTITKTGGSLPSGVTFTGGSGTASLSGTPAAGTGGIYSVTLQATNSSGTANQTFTLTVNEAPTITSANSTTFTLQTAGSFTVSATGYPAATFSETGVLPSGVTLKPSGVLSGTPAVGTTGNYPITITASNGVGTAATQSFTLTVGTVPGFTSAASTTFAVGTAGSYHITASGFPSPTFTETGALPSGVTLNSSTGVLSGTPAAGTAGVYNLTIKATNSVGSTTQAFTLTVNQAPAFTSANSATFVVGTSGSASITATGSPSPTITESGTLPSGVSFTTGTGSATLAGAPAAGTAGTYTLTITATNSAGTATQTFTLTVGQTPAFTSASSTTFTVGTAGTFTVTASGSPAPTFSETGALPAGVTLTAGGVLSGTPASGSGGSYGITITATNSAGTATQSFTLQVNQGPSFTSATSTSFQVGVSTTFTITATGAPLPSITKTAGTLPAGVTFSGGTGSATLSGTPQGGTAGAYVLTFTASNSVGSVNQTFTLNVNQPPAITSPSSTTFQVHRAGSFQVTASGYPAPTFSTTGPLPSGVTLSAGGLLSGTPAPGSSGTYSFTITASNGVSPNATQAFTLTVKGPYRVQQAVAGSGLNVTTVTPTLSGAVASGDALILTVADPGTTTVKSVSGGGVAWTKAASTASGNGGAEIWYGLNSSGTSGATPITVTFNNATTVDIANVSEWFGLSTFDKATTSNNNNGSAVSAGAITTAAGDEIIVSDAYAAKGNGSQPGPNNGFASLAQITVSGNYLGYGAWLESVPGGNISTTWTAPGSGHWAAAIAGFAP